MFSIQHWKKETRTKNDSGFYTSCLRWDSINYVILQILLWLYHTHYTNTLPAKVDIETGFSGCFAGGMTLQWNVPEKAVQWDYSQRNGFSTSVGVVHSLMCIRECMQVLTQFNISNIIWFTTHVPALSSSPFLWILQQVLSDGKDGTTKWNYSNNLETALTFFLHLFKWHLV